MDLRSFPFINFYRTAPEWLSSSVNGQRVARKRTDRLVCRLNFGKVSFQTRPPENLQRILKLLLLKQYVGRTEFLIETFYSSTQQEAGIISEGISRGEVEKELRF